MISSVWRKIKQILPLFRILIALNADADQFLEVSLWSISWLFSDFRVVDHNISIVVALVMR